MQIGAFFRLYQDRARLRSGCDRNSGANPIGQLSWPHQAGGAVGRQREFHPVRLERIDRVIAPGKTNISSSPMALKRLAEERVREILRRRHVAGGGKQRQTRCRPRCAGLLRVSVATPRRLCPRFPGPRPAPAVHELFATSSSRTRSRVRRDLAKYGAAIGRQDGVIMSISIAPGRSSFCFKAILLFRADFTSAHRR